MSKFENDIISNVWETFTGYITLHGYLVRKKQLETPSERSKLLTEVPKVTADVLEPESTSPHEQIQSADIQQFNDSPVLNYKDVLHPTDDLGKDQILPSYGSNAEEDDEVVILDGFDKDITKSSKSAGPEEQRVEDKPMPETKSLGQTLDWSNIIELTDDEEETHEQVDEDIWFYRDPQGEIQGPFSRTSLKGWSDDGYFGPDFKVWKDGQTPDRAILLTDII
ncbi:uncharacterized protein At5g08430-like [Bidens hawaiensis]|uniref:uncharacterized protein At5g08430-like n=1 Tax=Bidens hawaiensis TaxID=980011 RepID=UPI0040499C25